MPNKCKDLIHYTIKQEKTNLIINAICSLVKKTILLGMGNAKDYPTKVGSNGGGHRFAAAALSQRTDMAMRPTAPISIV